MDKQIVIECIGIGLGSALIVFKRRIATSLISIQNKNFGFKFAEKEIRSSEISTATIGLIIAILALVSLLKVTSFRI